MEIKIRQYSAREELFVFVQLIFPENIFVPTVRHAAHPSNRWRIAPYPVEKMRDDYG